MWLFLLVLASDGSLHGCRAERRPTPPPDTAPLVLPMETVNGHLVVVLEDRALGKLRLLIDTGAEKTLLTARAATKVKVDRHFTDRFYTFNGFGQGKKAKLAGHTSLELRSGERSLARVEALVLDSNTLGRGRAAGARMGFWGGTFSSTCACGWTAKGSG
jgi:predicted aspartyl protease